MICRLRRRREHDDQGSVGRSVPSPDRSDRQLLQREPASIRTGASRSPSGRAMSSRSRWCSKGWTSSRRRRSGARSSTGWPVLRRISASCQRHGSWLCRPGASGTLRSSRKSPAWCLRTTGRALPRPTCSGRPIGKRRDRSCMATSRHGFPPRSCSRTGRNCSAMPCSRRAGIGACLCMSTRALPGAPADAIAAATDTAMNPAVLDAFALIISGAEGPPAYPGIPGHEPDLPAARRHAEAIDRAMTEMRTLLPTVGSYVAESDFFEAAVAGILLGCELHEAARREGQVRSGRALLRPPRRRQRTLERRRLHEIGRPLSRDDQAGSRRSGLMVTT